jgi:hypothetical protein
MTSYNFKYAFPVAIEWDQQALINLFNENSSKMNLATMRLRTHEHPLLAQMQTKYPWLGDYVDFFVTWPGVGYPIHIDITKPDRKVVLNFPLLNYQGTLTNWYNLDSNVNWIQTDETESRRSDHGVYTSTGKFLDHKSIDSKPIPVYSLEMLEPVVIETKIPHDVKRKGSLKRVIASWHLDFDNFKQAREYLIDTGTVPELSR